MSDRALVKIKNKNENFSNFNIIFSCICLAKNKTRIYYEVCDNLVKKEASLDVILDKLYNFQKVSNNNLKSSLKTENNVNVIKVFSKFKDQENKIKQLRKITEKNIEQIM